MISVVVCTYNRVDALKKCLQSFSTISFDESWELIVVNNNSSDGTNEFLIEYKKNSNLPLKIVFEKEKGLGNARNAGIKAALFNIIAFTDDDCYPSVDYLNAIKKCSEESDIDFWGGKVLLHDPTDLPITIKLDSKPVMYSNKSIIKAGDIHGANFFFRKGILEKIGGFDPLFGAGAKFPCEDIDVLAECIRVGAIGKYDPTVIVSHDHGRKTDLELESIMKSYDIGRGAFYIKRIIFKKGQRMKYLFVWLKSMLKQPIRKTLVEINAAIEYLKCLRV